MGVRQFNIGMNHKLKDVPYLSHRKGKRYDGRSDQASYDHGYNLSKDEIRRVKEQQIQRAIAQLEPE